MARLTNLSRRGLLGILAAGVGAAIIRPGLIMPIKPALAMPKLDLNRLIYKIDPLEVPSFELTSATCMSQFYQAGSEPDVMMIPAGWEKTLGNYAAPFYGR